MTEFTPTADSLPALYTPAPIKRFLWSALFAGALGLAGVGVWSGLRGPRVASGLGLTGVQSGDGIQLSWNSDSEAIRRSRLGIVSVVDGPLRANIQLRSKNLAAGKIYYTAVSNDVHFRLKVLTGDKWKEGKPLRMHLSPEHVEAPSDVPAPSSASPSGSGDANRSGADRLWERTPIGQAKRRTFEGTADLPVRTPAIPEAPGAQPLPVPGNSAGLEIVNNLPTAVPSGLPGRDVAAKSTDLKGTPPITPAVLVQHVNPILPPDLQRMIDHEVRLSVRLTINE